MIRTGVAMLVTTVIMLTVTTSALPEGRGYEIWFAGRIVSVDARSGTLVIARGPTETAPPGVEHCTMAREPLRRLTAGMEVEAQADTRQRPWRILHLRIFKVRATRKSAAAMVALS